MPNNVRVGVQVTGAAKGASDIDKFRDKITNLQNTIAKTTPKGIALGLGGAAGLAAFRAVGSAVHDVTQIVDEATTAYIDNEHSVQKLNTAIKANVANWDGDTKAIDARLEAGVKLGFSNAEIRDSMAGLVAATHDVNDALHVQNVAMDLARFKGISLQDASDALTKVEAGSYRILKSLGIELKNGATQTEALAAVEKVAGGQAADFANTLEGKLAVAAAKTTESLSRLGKETASFKADFETAKADAIDNFATGLDFVADRANYSSQSLERQVEILQVQRNELRQGSDAWNTMTAAIDDLQKRIHAGAMSDLAHFPGKLKDDLDGANAALAVTSDAVRVLGKAFNWTTDTVNQQIDALNKLDQAGRIQDDINALEAWKKATGDLNDEQQHLYDTLDANYKRAKMLADVQFGGMVFTGIPNATGKQAHSTQTVNVNVHLTSSQSIITPGAAYAIAQRLGPYLAKYLQSHNLVPHQAVL